MRTNAASSLSCFVLSAALIVSAGCGADSPTPPRPNAEAQLAIVVVGGGSQQGFPGDVLDAPVIVQIIDSAGRPAAGKRRIRFSVVAGAGSVSDTSVFSSDNGDASVTWRLGAAVGGQQIAAALAAPGANARTTVSATAVSPDAADLVVLRGATSGKVNVLINQDDSYTRHTLAWPDTVLRLLPRGEHGTWQEVTAFSFDHPPATALRPWTAGVDTVHLALRAAIAVPFTMWVTHEFDTTAARARYDASQVDKFWRSHMTGLRVGPVRIERLLEYERKIFLCSDIPGDHDPAAINVYYLANQINELGGARPAFQCSASKLLMGINFFAFDPSYQNLLAHEAGHAFGLDHIADPSNVMNGWPLGSNLTTGQIYLMHFQSTGTANAVLKAHTVGVRNCYSTLTHCPSQTFVAW
jgi:hypothetical protein